MLRPFKDPRTGVYYFRKVVPKLLRSKLGKTEIKISLNTKDPREAATKFYEEVVRCEKLFDNIKSGFTLSHKRAKELASLIVPLLVQAVKDIIRTVKNNAFISTI